MPYGLFYVNLKSGSIPPEHNKLHNIVDMKIVDPNASTCKIATAGRFQVLKSLTLILTI